MDKAKILQELTGIFGKENVFNDPETLEKYSHDMTEHEAHMPDFVVKPLTVDQITSLMKVANEHKIPLVPICAGTNLGGLCIPIHGGIMVDLMQMKKVVEVNEDEMYAVLEPGVTFGELREYLDTHHPGYVFGYPLSPPWTSVMCNCLLDGLANLSNRHGTMSDWINGLEAVLPTGEVLRAGAGAASPIQYARCPLPDLTGLFISWQGTTGIVTKIAVQIWPKTKYRERFFCLAYDVYTTYGLIRKFARSGLFDDIGGLSWPTGKMLMGIQYPSPVRDPLEPEFFLYLDITGNTEAEINFKKQFIKDSLDESRKAGGKIEEPFDVQTLVKINPEFSRLAEFPTTLTFLLDHPGGGLTWVGTYGPTKRWEEGINKGFEVLAANGFPPIAVTRPMRGGHFAVLRFISIFNKQKPEEVVAVKRAMIGVAEACMDLGYIPYKTPVWVVEKLKHKMDPGYFQTLQRVKNLLDPNHIMNPGKWTL